MLAPCLLSIDAHCRNQPNKIKLVPNKLLIHFNSYLKQMYVSNKAVTECFSYKVGVVYVGVHISVWRHLKEELVFAKTQHLEYYSFTINEHCEDMF